MPSDKTHGVLVSITSAIVPLNNHYLKVNSHTSKDIYLIIDKVCSKPTKKLSRQAKSNFTSIFISLKDHLHVRDKNVTVKVELMIVAVD